MTPRNASLHIHPHKLFLAAFIFMAAYLTTITVNAQEAQVTGDAIQLNSNNTAVITGTIKEADENYVIIDSAGKDMKVVLDKVDMKGEADEVFTKGMMVTVDGKMTGNDFGMPIVDARSITATEAPGAAGDDSKVVP